MTAPPCPSCDALNAEEQATVHGVHWHCLVCHATFTATERVAPDGAPLPGSA